MRHPTYDQEIFPHWESLPIRFRDLDPLNHVNNAIFSTYYEEARIKFIQHVPSFANQMQDGFSFVLANINIDFVHPAEYPDNLLVGSGILSTGNSSISSFQAIYLESDKSLVSVAQAHGVWFDLEKQRPAKLPDFSKASDLLLPDGFIDS